jgi:hypothetical protein
MCETGTGQQVAQLHDSYMMMMMTLTYSGGKWEEGKYTLHINSVVAQSLTSAWFKVHQEMTTVF